MRFSPGLDMAADGDNQAEDLHGDAAKDEAGAGGWARE
jgi:hypothetical protein